MRLKYIAFEGIDGSGKDTQLSLLAHQLEREGITPIVLFEPSFGVFGRRIRAGLTSMTDNIDEQRKLFSVDRFDHVTTKVAPALRFVRANPGFVILQNRSFFSAAAYQPVAGGSEGLLATIDGELRVAPMPELAIVLDLPVELALERIHKEGIGDAMERPDRLAGARDRYRRLCTLYTMCRLVDAVGDPLTVAARVYAEIMGSSQD